ncbi:hypothetical protein PT126_05310 [Erysipelothrix rhusiopathiae]|nr:hypothetical protein [Erysipelothrix rhusiopathiae]
MEFKVKKNMSCKRIVSPISIGFSFETIQWVDHELKEGQIIKYLESHDPFEEIKFLLSDNKTIIAIEEDKIAEHLERI